MTIDRPNFYILGAAKSGTTSLWHYLNQHPDIFMSNPKEPNFMAFKNKSLPPLKGPCDDDYLLKNIYNNTVTNIDDYNALFVENGGRFAIGEGSVRYLYFKEAVENIKEYTPNAKFVLILRNPVDRLYSHYCMMRRYALEPLSLNGALKEEENRKSRNWGWDWHYKSVSKYGEQLERYFSVFNRSQFKVIFYEDFKQNTFNSLKEIYDFLGVLPDFQQNRINSKNVGFLPKNYTVHHWLKQDENRKKLKKILPGKLFFKSVQIIESINKKPIPEINKDSRFQISEFFKDDILKLEDLLNVKTGWI